MFDELKRSLQKDLISSINEGTSPKKIKKINNGKINLMLNTGIKAYIREHKNLRLNQSHDSPNKKRKLCRNETNTIIDTQSNKQEKLTEVDSPKEYLETNTITLKNQSNIIDTQSNKPEKLTEVDKERRLIIDTQNNKPEKLTEVDSSNKERRLIIDTQNNKSEKLTEVDSSNKERRLIIDTQNNKPEKTEVDISNKQHGFCRKEALKGYKSIILNEIIKLRIDKINKISDIDTVENQNQQIESVENLNQQIEVAFSGTKGTSYTKWNSVLLFLKLTEAKDAEEIGNVLKLKKDNVRKILEGFKRVKIFLSYFSSKDYYKINLGISVFRKIKCNDWNEVLNKLDN